MGYGVSQSYGFSLPTESMDGQKLWVITEYGLPKLWVKTELTVVPTILLSTGLMHLRQDHRAETIILAIYDLFQDYVVLI